MKHFHLNNNTKINAFFLSMATRSVFLLLPFAYVFQKYKESTLQFAWRQWFCKCATPLHYFYIAYFAYFIRNLSVRMHPQHNKMLPAYVVPTMIFKEE